MCTRVAASSLKCTSHFHNKTNKPSTSVILLWMFGDCLAPQSSVDMVMAAFIPPQSRIDHRASYAVEYRNKSQRGIM